MRLLVFISFVAAVTATTDKWTTMRVTLGNEETGNNVEHTWKVPSTKQEALTGIWQEVDIDNDLNAQFLGVGESDYGFNPLYDSNGFLAGAQLCQPQNDILNSLPGTVYSTYVPDASNTIEVKTIEGASYFCSTFLIVDPVTVRAGGRTEITNLGDGIWFKDTTDSVTGYRKVPTDADVLLEQTLYTQQNCMSSMGKHYFYNFTMDFECNNFYNWFLLGQENDVTGLGWQMFGGHSVKKQNWYDTLPRIGAEVIAPVVDKCLYDWVEQGIASVHIFFTDEPWNIKCGSGDSVESRIQTALRILRLRLFGNRN